jgi:small basic protein (TIGR04137 family)
MHKSLIPADRFGGHRNVLTRSERVARLEAEQKIKAEDSVFGILKVRIIRVKQKKKAEEETAEEGATAAAPGAAGSAAPGQAATPAPGAKPTAAEPKKEGKK